jgi:hypothetical protein
LGEYFLADWGNISFQFAVSHYSSREHVQDDGFPFAANDVNRHDHRAKLWIVDVPRPDHFLSHCALLSRPTFLDLLN